MLISVSLYFCLIEIPFKKLTLPSKASHIFHNYPSEYALIFTDLSILHYYHSCKIRYEIFVKSPKLDRILENVLYYESVFISFFQIDEGSEGGWRKRNSIVNRTLRLKTILL